MQSCVCPLQVSAVLGVHAGPGGAVQHTLCQQRALHTEV